MADSNRSRFNTANAFAVIGAIILVGSEVIATAVAAGWAIAGMFNTGVIGFWMFEVAFVGAAIAGVGMFAKRALETEPLFTRDGR